MFVILIVYLMIELHVNKLIIGKTTSSCEYEDIVSSDCTLFSCFSCTGERLDRGDCMSTTNKYSRELSVCNFLFC